MLQRLDDWRTNLTLALTAAALVAGCAGPTQHNADGAVVPEGTGLDPAATTRASDSADGQRVEAQAVGPVASDEPSRPETVPTFRDDDPLFEPLPPVGTDPGHEPPEEYAQMLRELVVDGLQASTRMLATGELDEVLLSATHDARAYERVAAGIEQLAAEGLVERTPDLRFSELTIDYRTHFQIWVRACLLPGPRTGLYDVESREMVSQSGGRPQAVDLLVSRRSLSPGDDPQFRIVDFFPQLGQVCG